MNRKVIGAVLGLAVIAAAVWFFLLRGGDGPAKDPTAGRSGDVGSAGTKPATPPPDRSGTGAGGSAPAWSLDPDRVGPLVLEGQVVDAAGNGVAGAEVWLASVPKRSTKTEDDGTFSFDKLVARTYELAAHDAGRTGGVRYRFTGKGDPAVIKLADGASLEVMVVDDAAKPIADADVRVGDLAEITARSDGAGLARLQPVEPGYVGVEVSASGFAPVETFTTLGSSGAKGTMRVVLRKGFALAGRVLDERGNAIANARVSVSHGPWGSFNADPREQVLSAADGTFKIPAVAAGRHTVYAADGDHAPARSTPVSVSDKAVSGVEIRMKDGGAISGRVVDAKGARVPYATVRVAGAGADMWSARPRQANASAEGTFELRGLARGKLQLRGESETAASQITDVDLSVSAAKTGLELKLDVTGTISGIVVDGTGAPVAETQVNGFPDFLKNGGGGSGMALAGMATASTDGGGRFTLIGLTEGDYRLWASRGRNRFDFGRDGVAAKVGDTAVKIVVLAPGSVTGSIAMDGASVPPQIASVQVGAEPPTPAQAGTFEVRSLAPGRYDVHVRGPEFAETVRRGVEITAGAVTELGVITVKRGRRLTGTVKDKSGSPVAGARIQLGDMIFYAEGAEDQEESWQDLYGIRSSVTDQAGTFTIVGVPEKGTQVAANHPTGRSDAVAIPAGTDDPPPVALTLRGFGSVVGTVTRLGQPVANANVTHSSKDGGTQIAMTRTDDSGAFRLDKVPAGTVVLQAMQSQMMAAKLASVTVEVVAGAETKAAIEFPVGNIELTVSIQGKDNAVLSMAMVVLVNGTMIVANAKELTDLGTKGGVAAQKPWTPGNDAVFSELVDGTYSLCSVPISGSPMDPRLQEHMMTLKVYCQQVIVTPAPTKQAVVQILPAMEPFPADDGSGSGSGG